MILGATTGLTSIFVDQEPDLTMFNHYLLGQSIGIPALVIGQQLFAFLSLENQTKRTMAASISCFIVNYLIIAYVGTVGLSSFAASNNVLASIFLIPAMKMNGLYISNILNGFICLAVIVIAACIETKRFPKNLEDIMAIPEGFSPGPEDRLDITVREMDQVENVSEKIIEFCEERGIDRRRSYFAGLCLEEMAGNVVTHGFSKDSKHHSIDIRVVHSGDDVILRLRDNCKEFNPSKRAQTNEIGPDGKNIGIKMVYTISDEVTYQNLLGLNVLTIKL